jgi:hypothetical protein
LSHFTSIKSSKPAKNKVFVLPMESLGKIFKVENSSDVVFQENSSIIKTDVWEIIPIPEDKSVVSSKWIYKIKYATDGSIDKYKARFVAWGFSQKGGVDYEKTFTPVARYTSIRAIISIATQMGWKMDIKTSFLNGKIEEVVYLEQPQGFEVHDKASYDCRLKKACMASNKHTRLGTP